ncbi:MAG: HD domain-containing protein [Spirochaetes bacterium]|nr:HD domain-containing protein [Spirochaetota bacterium]
MEDFAGKNEIAIDLSRYEEISHSFFEKLSGEKILTFNIYDQNENIIFHAGKSITKEEIAEKSKQGIRFFIPRISEKVGNYDYEIFSQDRIKSLAENTAATYANVRQTGTMTYEQYLNTHRDMVELLSNLKSEDRYGGVLSLLKDISNFDYYTYVHSVNVGLLAMVYQYKTSYNADRIRTMSIAGYLHDIGKLRIPKEIVDKPGPLSKEEMKIMLEHTREGYRILADVEKYSPQKKISDLIKYGALFHHRKFVIYGYPNRKERDGASREFYFKLPEEVRILGICDMYDALTTTTPWRQGNEPRTALRYILNTSNYYFSVSDVHLFLKALSLSLNRGRDFLEEGNFVMIESGGRIVGKDQRTPISYEFARIIEIFRGRPLTPRVEVFYDATLNRKKSRIQIDLRSDNFRKIVRVIESPRMNAMLRKLYMEKN